MDTRFDSFSKLFAHVWLRTIAVITTVVLLVALVATITWGYASGQTFESIVHFLGYSAAIGLYFGAWIAVLFGWVFALIISSVVWPTLKKIERDFPDEGPVRSSSFPLAMLCPRQCPPVEENPYRYD